MIIERNLKGGIITARNFEGGAEFIVASPLYPVHHLEL
jgi:hypothetical protein